MNAINPENRQADGAMPNSFGPNLSEPNQQEHGFFQSLVEPVSTLTESTRRRQASLVSAFLLALMLALTTGSIANVFVLHQPGITVILGSTAIMMAFVYALSRTKYYDLAQGLLILIIGILCVLDATVGNDRTAAGVLGVLAFNIILILICSVLVSLQTTILLAVLNMIGLALVPQVEPEITYNIMAMPLIFNGVMSAMILVLTQFRNLSERDRLQQLDRINISLQASNKALNERSSDLGARTRDLELSVEIGRTISQLGQVDVMLKNAVEMIQKGFSLYYVQVYLLDQSRTTLQLKAGTGSVGAELISRGHSLPVNSASINGRAVLEKNTVLVANTAASASYRPNPLLPETRSEMVVPLMLGDEVVGVLDLQSNHPGFLSQDVLPAFEALAGQLAIAIQNSNLLADAQQARLEVETQARRLVRTNWQDYLDAVHMPEKFGFVFDQNEVQPLTETLATEGVDEQAVSAPIAVTGEPIGTLSIDIAPERRTTGTAELVNIVARQVAQQIENLRLLESAERYRFEAEQSAHRLTREGWKEYTDSQATGKIKFLYDLREVKSMEHQQETQKEKQATSLPLKVREETVGKVAVLGMEKGDSESMSLVRQVAERLGEHIENLRQFEQTQTALGQSERLFEASRQMTLATDLQQLVQIAVQALRIPVLNRAILASLNYNQAQELEGVSVAANWWSGVGTQPAAVGARYTVGTSLFTGSEPLFVNDSQTDQRLDPETLGVVRQRSLRSGAILPLFLGTRQVGALLLEADEPHAFKQDEIRLITALAPQMTTVWENRRQFERAQRQAEREATLNAISQKIQSATSVDAVLQIAARELGHALGAPRTIAQLSLKDSK